MKTAQALARELTRHVMPSRGVAIELEETPSHGPDDLNWRAGAGVMEDDLERERYSQKVVELRKSDRLIDWSSVEGQPGHRVVTLRASDLK